MNHIFSRIGKAMLLASFLGAILTAFLFVPASASAASVPGTSLHTQPHQAGTFIHLATAVRSPAALPLALDPPTCSGTGCNGQNPYNTYCAGQSWDSWWVVSGAYISYPFYTHHAVGYVQLWWSQTCQTNWARVVAFAPAQPGGAQVILQHGPAGTRNWYLNDGSMVSAQLSAPVALADADGHIDIAGTVTANWTGQYPCC